MNDYIVTFFSHFGAVRFKKDMQKKNIAVRLMPVPRTLSSSCGTCASFAAEELPELGKLDEIEQAVKVQHGSAEEYEVLYFAEG